MYLIIHTFPKHCIATTQPIAHQITLPPVEPRIATKAYTFHLHGSCGPPQRICLLCPLLGENIFAFCLMPLSRYTLEA